MAFAHVVYQPDADDILQEIDTVFADYSDPDEMRRSLINHDGYDERIVVECNGKRSPEGK